MNFGLRQGLFLRFLSNPFSILLDMKAILLLSIIPLSSTFIALAKGKLRHENDLTKIKPLDRLSPFFFSSKLRHTSGSALNLQSQAFYGDVSPVVEDFDPQLPLPQAISFAFIVVAFSLLRIKVAEIQARKEAYEETMEAYREAVLLGLSEPSARRSEEILRIEGEVNTKRMAWENAKEIAPGIRVATADSNTEAQQVKGGPSEETNSRVTNPAALVLLGAVAFVLISTLFLMAADPMKGGWDGR